MSGKLGLAPADARAIRKLRSAAPQTQAKAALRIAPDAAKARRAWTWGKAAMRLEVGQIVGRPTGNVVQLFELHATEYRAAKGKNSRTAVYRHDHDPPYATICVLPGTAPAGVKPIGLARGSSLPGALPKAVYALGELVAFEGLDGAGQLVRLDVPSVARGMVYLIAAPGRRDCHVSLTTATAQRVLPPLYIRRGASRYQPTPAGIVR